MTPENERMLDSKSQGKEAHDRLQWWERGDANWNYEDYTDCITDYDMSVEYTVTVYNEEGQDDETIVYTTPGPPYTGR